MQTLALVLGCFLCLGHGFDKRASDSHDTGKVEVTSTYRVLAELIGALEHQAAFSPSASGALLYGRNPTAGSASSISSSHAVDKVLSRRTQPCRLADSEGKKQLKDLMEALKRGDQGAVNRMKKDFKIKSQAEIDDDANWEAEMAAAKERLGEEQFETTLAKNAAGPKQEKFEKTSIDIDELNSLLGATSKAGLAKAAEERYRQEMEAEEAPKVKRFQRKTATRVIDNGTDVYEEEYLVNDPVANAAIPDNGVVVVAGASTQLGKLVVRALGGVSSTWQLKALVPKGTSFDSGTECETIDDSDLVDSLKNAKALIVITEAVGGAGGINKDTMSKLLKSLPRNMKRLVTTSIHGVKRKNDELQFKMKNFLGQIDKEGDLEDAVVLKAKNNSGSYAVLRVGEIEDDFSSVASGTMSSSISSRKALAYGDALYGGVPMSVAAQVLAQSLKREDCINATFSIGDARPEDKTAAGAPDDAYWDDQFNKLVGPDIFRKAIKADVAWVQAWGKAASDQVKVATKFEVSAIENGVLLRFMKRPSNFSPSGVKENKFTAQKRTELNKKKPSIPDGGLMIVYESEPSPRVRVARAEMEEGMVVKKMSEEKILQQLETDLANLEKSKAR